MCCQFGVAWRAIKASKSLILCALVIYSNAEEPTSFDLSFLNEIRCVVSFALSCAPKSSGKGVIFAGGNDGGGCLSGKCRCGPSDMMTIIDVVAAVGNDDLGCEKRLEGGED